MIIKNKEEDFILKDRSDNNNNNKVGVLTSAVGALI